MNDKRNHTARQRKTSAITRNVQILFLLASVRDTPSISRSLYISVSLTLFRVFLSLPHVLPSHSLTHPITHRFTKSPTHSLTNLFSHSITIPLTHLIQSSKAFHTRICSSVSFLGVGAAAGTDSPSAALESWPSPWPWPWP